MRIGIALLVASAVVVALFQDSGSKPPAPPQDKSRFKNGAAQMYDCVFNDFATREETDAARATWPYDSISIQRTACFGNCPVYKATFHRDGCAELHVEADFTLPKGDYVTVIGFRTFGRYCCALDSIKFQSLAPRYEADWTDDATCIVTASLGDKEEAVSDYGTVAPIGLWMVQEALDGFVRAAEWSPKK